MKAAGGGSIINISSGYGVKVTNNKFAYGTTKNTLSAASLASPHDLGPFGIRVNCIMPGPIEAPMLRRSEYSKGARPKGVAGPQSLPVPRLGESAEIGNAVLFLASDMSSYVTGVESPVDGGALA